MTTPTIAPLKTTLLTIVLEGTTPLICHRFDEKSKQQMKDKQMKKAAKGREAKDPEALFKASLYPHPEGGYGFPAIAFKAAAVRAGKLVGMKMTDTKQCFHIVGGEYVKIEGEPAMREDIVRLQGTTADLRYRGEFKQWGTTLTIQFRADIISAEQIANLMNHAGFSVGVGEWRPEKDGVNGQFKVVTYNVDD